MVQEDYVCAQMILKISTVYGTLLNDPLSSPLSYHLKVLPTPSSHTPLLHFLHISPTQVRLCLDKKDYVRAQILSKKISPKAFVERKGEGKGEIGIEGTAIEAAEEVRACGLRQA